MSFYDDLGEKFDMMIRWKTRLEREAPFFQRLFSENRIHRVLDLGCGTGHHAHQFANWGCDVTGIDASASMLTVARDPVYGGENDHLRFLEADLTQFPEVVEGPFDAILSLGNTLPHILAEKDLKQVLKGVFDSLRPGGVFVFQNRNYDRLMKTRERFLLPNTYRQADNEQIFFRFNDFEEGKVRFNVVHFTRVGEGWIHEVHSTELSPWQQQDFETILQGLGFHSIDYYGDFSGTPFDADTTTDLVGLARKANNKG